FRPIKVIGSVSIAIEGGAIVASNILADVDSFFLPARIRRRVYFLAKKEYFTEKGLKGRFKRWFMLSTRQHPVDRSGGSASRAALDTGVRVLREGKLLGVYPAGTRSPDGRLCRGK